MKIIGMMVVGEGEGSRYLDKCLSRIKPLVDYIVVAGNYKDKATDDILKKHGAIVVDYSNKEWGREQWKIKQSLLENYIVPMKPDWILCLDADEVFDERLDRGRLEELTIRGEIAFTFYFVQLYDSEDKMRVDGYWSGFRNVRFWKYIPEANQVWQRTALHCGLAPMYAYNWCADSEYIVKHYGYLKATDRERKKLRYDKYDPQAWYKSKEWYDSILSKPDIRPFDEDKFVTQFRYQEKKPKLEKIMEKKKNGKTFYIQNKFGKIFGVNEEIYETIWKDRVAKGKAVLIADEIQTKAIEAPVVEKEVVENAPKEDELTCKICGKVSKSKVGAIAHQRKHK